MHRRAVVPDHEVADAPFVAVDEAAFGGVVAEVAQQQPPVGDRPADDVRCVRRQIEGLALRPRMPAHQPLPRRRVLLALARLELAKADLAARPENVVLGDEAVDLLPRRVGQRVAGGTDTANSMPSTTGTGM